VLYADWHATWYGDPQYQIMYHGYGQKNNGGYDIDYYKKKFGSMIVTRVSPPTAGNTVNGWQEVFHDFDALAGVGSTTPLP
jgi:hypothetical protein